MTFPPIELALVTGASSGLGRQLAKALSAQGIALILTGREESQLLSLAQELATPTRHLVLDLCSAEDRQKLLSEITTSSPDLIINNAGSGLYGDALSFPLREQLEIIELNVTAVVELTLESARAWIKKGKKGIILNVSSAAAFFSYPTFAIYAASKAFVLNFSTALDQEVADYGVRILTVCPGQIATRFRERASKNFPQKHDIWTMSTEKATQLILSQITQGQASLIIDWRYRCAVFLSRFLPKRWVSKRLKRSLQDRFKRHPLH